MCEDVCETLRDWDREEHEHLMDGASSSSLPHALTQTNLVKPQVGLRLSNNFARGFGP